MRLAASLLGLLLVLVAVAANPTLDKIDGPFQAQQAGQALIIPLTGISARAGVKLISVSIGNENLLSLRAYPLMMVSMCRSTYGVPVIQRMQYEPSTEEQNLYHRSPRADDLQFEA